MDVKMIIFLAVVVAVLPSALSIQCYQCSNSKDCTTKQNCTSSLDTCMYFYTKSTKTYLRSCNTKKACATTVDACKKSPGTCVALCCQKDLCNKDAPVNPVTTAPVTKPSTTPVTTKPSTANTQKPLFIVSGVLSFFASLFYLM